MTITRPAPPSVARGYAPALPGDTDPLRRRRLRPPTRRAIRTPPRRRLPPGAVLHVRRRFTSGMLKDGGKTVGSVRTVPLRKVVLDALDAMPPRIDTPILVPAPRGYYMTSRSSSTANGHPRSAPRGSRTGRSRRCGTRSPHGRSRPASSSRSSPDHGHKCPRVRGHLLPIHDPHGRPAPRCVRRLRRSRRGVVGGAFSPGKKS
jgi:hypothetical protein